MKTQMSPNWPFFWGLFVIGAVLKVVVSRIAESPVATKPTHPSVVGTLVVGRLVKDTVSKVGRAA